MVAAGRPRSVRTLPLQMIYPSRIQRGVERRNDLDFGGTSVRAAESATGQSVSLFGSPVQPAGQQLSADRTHAT